MRAISTFLPQALLISAGVGLSLDTASTVGTATVELESRGETEHAGANDQDALRGHLP